MKTCSICKEEKSLEDFNLRDGGLRRRNNCKKCQQIYGTKRAPQVRLKRKIELVEALGIKCNSCKGVYPPCCYDFHHKDMATKERSPTFYLLASPEKRQKILDDCVLLCANCHRIEHSQNKSIPNSWLEE